MEPPQGFDDDHPLTDGYRTYAGSGSPVDTGPPAEPAQPSPVLIEEAVEETTGTAVPAHQIDDFRGAETVPPQAPPPWTRLTGYLTDPGRQPALLRILIGAALILLLAVGALIGSTIRSTSKAVGAILPASIATQGITVTPTTAVVTDGPGHIISVRLSNLSTISSITDPEQPTGLFDDGSQVIVFDHTSIEGLNRRTLQRLWGTAGHGRFVAVAGGHGHPIVVVGRHGRHGTMCLLVHHQLAHCHELAFAPSGVGVDRNGNVYVVDGKHGRILRYRLHHGRFKRHGKPITLPPGHNLRNPIVISGNNIIIADDSSVYVINSTTGRQESSMEFDSAIADMWVSPAGQVFVAEYLTNEVQWASLSAPDQLHTVHIDKPVALDGNANGVFVLTEGDMVAQINPATGRIVQSRQLAVSAAAVVPPVTGAIDITRIPLGYDVTVALSRGRLMPQSLTSTDNHIADRHGAVQVWESGITATQTTASRYGLVVSMKGAAGDVMNVDIANRGPSKLASMDEHENQSHTAVVITLGTRALPKLEHVPMVVGLPKAQAEQKITSAGLTVGLIVLAHSSSVPRGDVISSSPVANTPLRHGQPVALTVSVGAGTGPITTRVPSVVGRSQSAAESAITGAHLHVGTVTTENSTTVPRGDVMRSSPAAGVVVKQGSPVNLVVSKGPATVSVPCLTGHMETTEMAALRAAGLNLGVVTMQYDRSHPGVLLGCSPTGSQPIGAKIGLTVSAGFPPAPSIDSISTDPNKITATVWFSEKDTHATVWCELLNSAGAADSGPAACSSPWTVPVDTSGEVNCTVSKTFVLWATDAGLTTNQTSQEFRFTWPC
ncbi:MAG: PASTA domain-containing protein [Gaiellales bacterium]